MRNVRFLVLIFLTISFFLWNTFAYGAVSASVNWYIYDGKFIVNVRSPQSIKYVTFTLEDPLRFVLDVYNSTFPKTEIFNIGITPISTLRLSPRDDSSFRLVLDCDKVPQYNISLSKDERSLTGEFLLENSTQFNLIKKILYGNDRVSIYSTGSFPFKSTLDTNPPKLILEFPSTSFSGEVSKLDNSNFIDKIIAYNYEDIYKKMNTVVVIELKKLKDPLISEDKQSKIVAIDFGGAKRTVTPQVVTQISKKPESQKSSIDQGKRVSISFKDADVKDVLQALSIKAGVNILIDEEVNKRLTLRLENVTAREGLEMITKASGLAYERWDNGYIVATPERLGLILDSGIKRISPPISKQVVSAVEIMGDIGQVQNALKGVYPEVVTSISG
ncbi:MAG: AMIN domain-containing protein, partial [bacterium]